MPIVCRVPVALNAIPAHNRPRERLLRRGVDALSEQELLSLVIKHGRQGESALEIASALLVAYGGLSRLAVARPEELASRPGVGPAKACALTAAFHLGRLMRVGSEHPPLRCASDVAAVATAELGHLRVERVLALVCDAQNRLRQITVVSDGTIDSARLPVRDILSAVLRHDGRAFAIAHSNYSRLGLVVVLVGGAAGVQDSASVQGILRRWLVQGVVRRGRVARIWGRGSRSWRRSWSSCVPRSLNVMA
jgi:DNA repair protein RadC